MSQTDKEYSEDKYGDGSYGGTIRSILDSALIKLFPEVMPRETESVLYRYLDAHDEIFEDIGRDISYTIRSRQVKNARSSDLNRIGSLFGELGERRGRSDNEYQAYLKGLLQTFNARGTKPGLKFAIAAAVNTDTENITIVEDFEDTSYQIRIDDVNASFLSSAVNDVAQLADPSGVDLSRPPIVIFEGADIAIDVTESSVIESTQGLGADTLTLDGSSQLGG